MRDREAYYTPPQGHNWSSPDYEKLQDKCPSDLQQINGLKKIRKGGGTYWLRDLRDISAKSNVLRSWVWIWFKQIKYKNKLSCQTTGKNDMWTGYNTKLGNNDNFVVWGNSILVIKKKNTESIGDICDVFMDQRIWYLGFALKFIGPLSWEIWWNKMLLLEAGKG